MGDLLVSKKNPSFIYKMWKRASMNSISHKRNKLQRHPIKNETHKMYYVQWSI